MNVVSLITINDPAQFDVCTLLFKTLRVGFPTAEVTIYHNCKIPENTEECKKIEAKAKELECYYTKVYNEHHASWIKDLIEYEDGPLAIIDPDILFWKDCEWFHFDTPLAGFHVPVIYNEWAKCISFERLHTSFLWIRDCEELRAKIQEAYPFASQPFGEYRPVDPYGPRVSFVRGKPMFHDTCSMLYNMIGGTSFGSEHLCCYDHVNSASFYEDMLAEVEDKESFRRMHEIARTEPERLKGFHKSVMLYYENMNKRAIIAERGGEMI